MIRLEALLTSPHGAGLTTISVAQRIVCRVADGVSLGDLRDHPDAAALLGGSAAVFQWEAVCGGEPPREVYLLAGIRSGKSLIAAVAAVRSALGCDLSSLRSSDVPRVSVISLRVDLAHVVFQHLLGIVRGSTALRTLLMREPTSDTVTLRHASGRPVEVAVVAGAKAGGSVVARWSAGLVADEFPRMVGADEGAITFDDARSSVLGRLLPGAQLWGIGSPWAPWGPAHRVVTEHHGNPQRDLVVMRATAPQMNPGYWTAERVASLRERDELAYRTDVLGEFATPETSPFPTEVLERQTRQTPAELPWEAGSYYLAAMDPATRSNGWTLVVLTRRRASDGGGRRVVLARQWMPRHGQPLSPDETLGEISEVLKPYGVGVVFSDQWSLDALADLGHRRGLSILQTTLGGPHKVALIDQIRSDLVDGQLELAPVREMRDDLQRVRRAVTRQGLSIELPRTADGRHCDYAAALSVAYANPLRAADEKPEPSHDWDGWTDEERRSVTALEKRLQRKRRLGL